MTCEYCKGTTWLLYKAPAPNPPYKEGDELEYAKRCVCFVPKRPNQDYQNKKT